MNSSDILFIVIGLFIGIAIGYLIRHLIYMNKLSKQREEADSILSVANEEAKRIEIQAKDKALETRQTAENEIARRRAELSKEEDRLLNRRNEIDDRSERIEKREQTLNKRQSTLDKQTNELEKMYSQELEELQRISQMTQDEAREILLREVEKEARADMARIMRQIEAEARAEGENRARKLVASAIQRVASEHVQEVTTSFVPLPNDEMKGRIIGRNGRNIHAFEQAAGVDVIVDDTPEAITISCFDSVRREVALRAMAKLVLDGRIHPAHIEKVIRKERDEVERVIVEAGDQAAYDAGGPGLHPEILRTLGRLKFRTSYGQNQLQHSKEVAHLAGNMAAELGLDAQMAKRMGLLHDIGKGMTHEHEGTHVELGYELCKRCGEPDQVLNAIRAHHGEEPACYPETFLLTAADAISGARPGARRESFEAYVKRLEKLEEIATSYDGVAKCFAIQAGREVRIMVTPEAVSDDEMAVLSEKTARRIEQELQYPGQIKVVVVRETRAVDFAR